MTLTIRNNTPIVVICAMHDELIHLQAMLPQAEEDWYEEHCSWITSLDNHPIIFCLCGIGMANAAAATEAVIERYHPTFILNYGCCGSHRLDLLPGDLVIGSRLIASDRVIIEADGYERYVGMWYLYHGIQKKVEYLSCPPFLLDLAMQTATILEGTHEPWPLIARWPSSVPHRSPQVHIGTITTSDRWNRAVNRISHLATQYDSICEDMEATAIALICASHNVPFIAIKDISNNEMHQTTDSLLLPTEITEQVGKRAAAFTFAMLRNYFLP